MQKITPFIWFEKGAEDAAKYYVDLFNGNPNKKKTSEVHGQNKYDEASSEVSGQPKDSVMVVSFNLEGQEFTAINGGPHLKLSGGISFVIECKDQKEIDYFWNKLSSEGGEAGQCGWINRDKYGVTWQVVPGGMSEWIAGKDDEGAARAMKAMLGMTKIVIADLEKAYKGK